MIRTLLAIGVTREEETARSCYTADALHSQQFEAVFHERYSRLVSILQRVTGDRAHAEELADDVFWKLYQQPQLLAAPDVGAWLYRTAVNAGIDAIRADGRRRRYESSAALRQQAPHMGADPLDATLAAEQAQQVRRTLASMKPAQAQLLVLRHSGLSYQELAAALNLNPNSIGTLLARAEAEFARRYGKERL